MRINPIEINHADSLPELKSKIVEAVNQVIDQLNLPDNGPINAKGHRVTNVAMPSASGDAISLAYLEQRVKSLPVINRRLSMLEQEEGAVGTSTWGGVMPIRSETATTTFTAGDFTVMMDCTSGNKSIYLIAAPTNGQIAVVKNLVGLNTLSVEGNGNTIDGATSVTTTTGGFRWMFQYFAATTDWKIIT